MRKVLIILTTVFNLYDGMGSVLLDYYRYMEKTDLKIDFASTNVVPKEINDELKRNDSKYFCLGSRLEKPVGYACNLLKLLKNEKYDIVHINANSATAALELVIAYVCGVKKRLVHIHNTSCKHLILHSLLKPLFDRTYTDAYACSIAAGKWIFKNNEFKVLKNAIDLGKYSYDCDNRHAVRKRYGIDDDEVLIGHVGNFEPEKNHQFLIELFVEIYKQNKRFKLMLIGDGHQKNNAEILVKRLSVSRKVMFSGFQSDASPFYSAFDIFVFPSLWEGMPLALIEAQANGLPCLISDTITSDAKLASNVFYKSLDDGADSWANVILSLAKNACVRNPCATEDVRAHGFDIRTEAGKLREIYLNNPKGERI